MNNVDYFQNSLNKDDFFNFSKRITSAFGWKYCNISAKKDADKFNLTLTASNKQYIVVDAFSAELDSKDVILKNAFSDFWYASMFEKYGREYHDAYLNYWHKKFDDELKIQIDKIYTDGFLPGFTDYDKLKKFVNKASKENQSKRNKLFNHIKELETSLTNDCESEKIL